MNACDWFSTCWLPLGFYDAYGLGKGRTDDKSLFWKWFLFLQQKNLGNKYTPFKQTRELTHKCPIGDKMNNWAFKIGDWGSEIGDWGIDWNWLE